MNSLDPKSQRIIKDTLNLLKENPYPHSRGDKERLHTGKNRSIYRMHSARSFTVIYLAGVKGVEREDPGQQVRG
nr:hypothetical protein [Methanofollis tationis]